LCDDLPSLVSDAAADGMPIFPREDQDSASVAALLRAPNGEQKAQLEERGFVATMRVPIVLDGKLLGEFRMAHTRSRQPSFELQAAAELFAQFVALRWQADQLSS
jgi:light-regulated signal transduction histidine kinase (bacteriophytochrome)